MGVYGKGDEDSSAKVCGQPLIFIVDYYWSDLSPICIGLVKKRELILLAESLPKVHPDQTSALSVFRSIFSSVLSPPKDGPALHRNVDLLIGF